MHSRIFQISEEPIEEENYALESDYYGNFIGHIADYVNEQEDDERKDDIEWLAKSLEGAAKIRGNKMTILSKEKFFEKKYEGFIKTAKKVAMMTFDDFITSVGEEDLYVLNSYHSNKYGFYVDEDGYPLTLDDFFRNVKDGDTYYIGATFDYHY